MSERPEDSLRRYFDEIAPPTDVEALADSALARPPRATGAWRFIAAGALAALLVIGVVALGLATIFDTTTALPTTDVPVVTATSLDSAPSPTASALDPGVVDHLVSLDDQLQSFLDEANRVNTRWETRALTFADARADLADLAHFLSIASVSVADDALLAGATGLDHPRLVETLTRAVSAAEALVTGLEAPDDGTLRREALAQLTQAVDEARTILAPLLPTPTEDPVAVDSSDPDTYRVVSADGIELGTIGEHGEGLTAALAPQVVIAARDSVLNDSQYGLGATFSERKQALFGCAANETPCEGGGGLTIYTTVDFALQERATAILEDWFPANSQLPTGAIAMVDNPTGAVVVMASGPDERAFDFATKGRRSLGSAFMPFALVAALESGIPLSSVWDYSTPQTLDYDGEEPLVCANAGDNPPGMRTLEEALYLSTNTVFCQVVIEVGATNVAEVASRLGIRSPLPIARTIVEGTANVSPLEMSAAYSTIANQGVRVDTYLIERIEDADGNVVYQHQIDTTRVVEPALAAAVINTLEKAVIIGTGQGAYIGHPQIGTTGSMEDFSDAWFVGAVPQFTTTVWVGFADSEAPMMNLVLRGTLIQRMYGGSAPASIWQEFMIDVLADLPIEDFPEDPPGTSAYYGNP